MASCIVIAIDKKAYSLLNTTQLQQQLNTYKTKCNGICKNAATCQKIRQENKNIIKDILSTREQIS